MRRSNEPDVLPAFRRRGFGQPGHHIEQAPHRSCAALVCVSLCAWPGAGNAHHSYAMFDADKQTTLSGTVKAFQFTNPHCFIQLLVQGSNRQVVEWSIEMGPPVGLMRSGWRKTTLTPGEKITVIFHPLKNGINGGGFMSALDGNNKKI